MRPGVFATRSFKEALVLELVFGLLVPSLGTSLGAACVFLLRRPLARGVERALSGFAAGVMVAASIFSLIVPSMEASSDLGPLAFVPATAGFWVGTLFLLLLDRAVPHLHLRASASEGPRTKLHRATLLVLAVTLHNIPEGMAVGVAFAGWMSGSGAVTLAGAVVLAVGIAIQNFPEGLIVSLPLRAGGGSRSKAFLLGVGSGVVEPIAALATIALSGLAVPLLPYLLGFAAGAMMYVVVEELIPQMSEGGHSNIGVVSFAVGFTLMMALDVALG